MAILTNTQSLADAERLPSDERLEALLAMDVVDANEVTNKLIPHENANQTWHVTIFS